MGAGAGAPPQLDGAGAGAEPEAGLEAGANHLLPATNNVSAETGSQAQHEGMPASHTGINQNVVRIMLLGGDCGEE